MIKKETNTNLVNYNSREIERVKNFVSITNKLLSIKTTLPDLIIEKTSTTPYINFNSATGILRIEGKSLPFNAGDIYNELIEWVGYFGNPQNCINYKIQLEHISANSLKYILGLFRVTENKIKANGTKCSVDWYYDEGDEYIFEVGEHYKKSFKLLPFYLIQI